MTLMGKAFTVLIFCFSTIFFALATAVNWTHVNTRALADQRKAEEQRLSTQSTQLTEMLTRIKDELALELDARRSVLAALQTQVEQMQFEVSAKTKEFNQIQENLTTLAQTHRQTSKERMDRGNEVEGLRKQLQDTIAARDVAYNKLKELTDQYHQMQGNLMALEARFASMANN